MTRPVKIVGRKRAEIDEKKLALAFLLLAKTMRQDMKAEVAETHESESQQEAA